MKLGAIDMGRRVQPCYAYIYVVHTRRMRVGLFGTGCLRTEEVRQTILRNAEKRDTMGTIASQRALFYVMLKTRPCITEGVGCFRAESGFRNIPLAELPSRGTNRRSRQG